MSNDRFKFRVWDKRKKRYVDCYVIGDDGLAYQLHCAGEDSYDLIPNEDVIIEQCTGLKDKNDKLVYEGDVVKTKDFGKDIDNRINVNDYDTFVVKFHECGFCIENDSRRFPMSCRPKLEIIGNIHENGERK